MSWDSNHPSSAGVVFHLDLNKKDKNEDELRLFKELVDQGYSQDAAKYLVDKHKDTGNIETGLPNFQNALQKGSQPNRPVPLPPTSDVPDRSTLQDFGPMRKKGFLALDPNNPPQSREDIVNSMIEVPDKFTNVSPVYVSKKSNGFDIYIDSKGNEIKREPNNSGSNKIIKIGSTRTGTGGSGSDDPLTKTALEYMKGYYKAVREGTADPDDPMLPSFAQHLGLQVEDLPSVENPKPNPSFMQKVFNIEPQAPPPTPGKTYPVVPGKGGQAKPALTPLKFNSDAEVRAAYQAGKIDRETAKKILQSQFGHK